MEQCKNWFQWQELLSLMRSRLASISTIPSRKLISGWVKFLEYPLTDIPSVTWAEILTPLTTDAQRSPATDLLSQGTQASTTMLVGHDFNQPKTATVTLSLQSADVETLGQKSYGQAFLGPIQYPEISSLLQAATWLFHWIRWMSQSAGCSVVLSDQLIGRCSGCLPFRFVRCWFSFFFFFSFINRRTKPGHRKDKSA
jgi:hypothetical protein